MRFGYMLVATSSELKLISRSARVRTLYVKIDLPAILTHVFFIPMVQYVAFRPTMKLPFASVSPVGIVDCLFFGTDSLVLVNHRDTIILVSEGTIVSHHSRTLETYRLGCLTGRVCNKPDKAERY